MLLFNLDKFVFQISNFQAFSLINFQLKAISSFCVKIDHEVNYMASDKLKRNSSLNFSRSFFSDNTKTDPGWLSNEKANDHAEFCYSYCSKKKKRKKK